MARTGESASDAGEGRGKGKGKGFEWDGRIQMKTVRIKAAAKWSGKLSVPGLQQAESWDKLSLCLSLSATLSQRLSSDSSYDFASC